MLVDLIHAYNIFMHVYKIMGTIMFFFFKAILTQLRQKNVLMSGFLDTDLVHIKHLGVENQK